MKLLIAKKDCLFSELKIPKGYRLLKDWEILRELRTNKKLKQLLIDGYVFCNHFSGEVRGSFLIILIDDSYFSADIRGVDYNLRRLRGVFTKVKL